MKLKFEIDTDYDIEMVAHMLRKDGWEYRAKKMELPENLVRKVSQAAENDLPGVLDELREEAEITYHKIRPYMERTLVQYQKSWDEIIEDFSALVEKKSVPWFYDEYICKLTNYNPGLSNWDGNVIGRWWKENAFRQRRITAHEILLAHYFSIHRNNYQNSGVDDKQIWALAEIFAFAMTGLDEDLRKLWPWDRRGYYTDHNYPHIVDLQLALEEPFIKMKSFDDYVKAGIDLVEKMYMPERSPGLFRNK